MTKALDKIALLEAQLRFRELQLIRAGLKTEEDLTIFKETPPPNSCLGTMHEHTRDLFLPIVAWLSSLALLAYFSPAAVNEVVFELWPQHGLSDPSHLEFFHNQETDTWGFGYCYPEAKEAVISFRGTISDENWSTNLDIKLSPLSPILGEDPVHYPSGYSDLLVHQGFNRAFLSIWPSVYKFIQTCRSSMGPDTRFAICGHSLGGALASLCFLYLTAFFPEISVDQGMLLFFFLFKNPCFLLFNLSSSLTLFYLFSFLSVD